MTFSNLMIDIETLGTRPNAPILSIGAAFFAPGTGEIGPTFYRAIDPANAFLFGVPDGDTFKWWMGQADAARRDVTSGSALLADALTDLSKFGSGVCQWKDVEVWANDPDFDVTILTYAYHRVLSQLPPWRFWNTRSCRTIAAISGKRPPKIGGNGTYHNALDDAVHQAKWVSDMWRSLRKVQTRAATVTVEKPTSVEDDLLDL